MPMLPDAPGRFSTVNDWPNFSFSFSARMRNSTSVEPPAGYGTIMRTFWLGQLPCAKAGAAENAAPAAAVRSRLRRVSTGIG